MALESDVSLEEKFGHLKMGTSFHDLPDELIEKVLFDLDAADRCRMRGMNKRLHGIEERMKTPLEDRRKLEISGRYSSADNSSPTLSMYRPGDIMPSPDEKVSLSNAIRLFHRFAKLFKFWVIEFSPFHAEHMEWLDCFAGIVADTLEFQDSTENHRLSTQSTICKLMQICEVVRIPGVCEQLTAQDLKQIYETSKNTDNFCGIKIRIPRKTAMEFVQDLNGEDKSIDSWGIAEKREGDIVVRVEQFLGHLCYNPRCDDRELTRFVIYNYGCEAKYPYLRRNIFVHMMTRSPNCAHWDWSSRRCCHN